MRGLSGDYAAQRKLFIDADEENVIRLEDQIRESAEKVAHGAHGPVQVAMFPQRRQDKFSVLSTSHTSTYMTLDVDVDPSLPRHGKQFIAENIIREQLGV